LLFLPVTHIQKLNFPVYKNSFTAVTPVNDSSIIAADESQAENLFLNAVNSVLSSNGAPSSIRGNN